MANLTIKAAHAYHSDGTVLTKYTISTVYGSTELTDITIDELRRFSALILNALADTATTHNAVAVRAHNARRR